MNSDMSSRASAGWGPLLAAAGIFAFIVVLANASREDIDFAVVAVLALLSIMLIAAGVVKHLTEDNE